MSLVRKLKKFGVGIPIVLGLSTGLFAQDKEVESLGQKAKSQDLGEIYKKEVIFKNLLEDVNLGLGFSFSSPKDSHLRRDFPIQYGGEILIDKKILENGLKATTFVEFYKAYDNSEINRTLDASSVGIGLEYSKILDWGAGFLHKEQEISGPRNGFLNHVKKNGFYLYAKKEIPFLEGKVKVYTKAKYNSVKEISNSEISLGAIINLN